jgi:crotonobetainyl-CoA:carnitine CoA-transferase CaiB-like acyl-CoA transferase
VVLSGSSPAPELDPAPRGPLAGLLVADFSRILAGPYATMLLGDLGATVVKVESPAGDDTRTWMPPVHEGVATYYLSVNRNKRSVVLDLKDEEDRRLAERLVERADVMIENFRPGQLARYSLDWERVHARNPRCVMASITAFGSNGEGAGLPGYDLMVQAMSGLMSLTGDPEGPAMRSGIAVFDILAGLHATVGILAALAERERSGEGQHVEVSLMASALSGMANHTTAWVVGGVVPYRMGNAHPSLFPYEPLPTADGELVVIAGNDRQFRALVDVLGVPELAERPEFARNEDRTANREILRPLLVERLRTRPAREWFDLLIARDVPCAPILTVDDGVAMAERLGLAPTVPVPSDQPSFPMVRHPIGLSRTPPRYDLAPPALDQDGALVRRWLTEGAGQPMSGAAGQAGRAGTGTDQ